MSREDKEQGKAVPVALSNYESSRVFAQLKDIKERIGVDANLTTPQYLQTYDDLLDNAVRPILDNCRFFDSYLLRILGWQERNFRRKVSFLKRAEFPRLAVGFVLKRSPEERFAAYQDLRLDRLIRMQVVSLFHSSLENYLAACECELTPPAGVDQASFCFAVKAKVEESMKSTPGGLLSAYHESKFWFEHAADFKRILMEKYVRLCLNTAKRDYVYYFKCQGKLDDIIQTYLIAMSRAIDKCDAKQGALTSHIQNWFFSARDAVARQRERNTVSLDQENGDLANSASNSLDLANLSVYEERRREQEDVNLIAELSRIADPHGAARAFLGIPEHLKESEIQLLLTKRNESNEQQPKSTTRGRNKT